MASFRSRVHVQGMKKTFAFILTATALTFGLCYAQQTPAPPQLPSQLPGTQPPQLPSVPSQLPGTQPPQLPSVPSQLPGAQPWPLSTNDPDRF
jgi:hypothetical protein